VSKARAEAFSDGVFAIAATLLVLELKDPLAASGHLLEGLLRQWPSYVAYATSFATIVIIWVNHHAVLATLKSLDLPLLFLNGLLLMAVAVIPFPTGLLAHYLQTGPPADANTAAVVYGLSAIAMIVAFSLVSLYARSRGLMQAEFNVVAFSIGLLLYPLATIVSAFSAQVGLVIYVLVALFYIALPLARKVG
jgi:uncharacterized membrane protein